MIWKRNTVSLRNTAAAKAYLEDMAREGLFLEKASVFRGLQFREDFPEEMDYLVVWVEGEMSETEKAAYVDKGWTFVCRYMQIYVFCAPAGAESPAEKTEQYRQWAEKLRKNRRGAVLILLLYVFVVGAKAYDAYRELRETNFYSGMSDVYIIILFLLGGVSYLYSEYCERAAVREIEDEDGDIPTINWQRFRWRDSFNRMMPFFYLIALVLMMLIMVMMFR